MPTATASISVEDAVNRRRGDLVELSHSIHAEPELAFAEHRSCAKTQALVAEYGFEITAAPGGLDTAFRADFGSGPLVVGICAEYDALPDIGHACGHNIIAASAVGTALALAEVADELGLTVALIGTPAEEAGGGKALLLKAGTFDDIAATVMLHPGPLDIAARTLAGAVQVAVRYSGREAHAAVAPYLGHQRRRRDHRRAGGDRPAAAAAGARADGARHRHRRRAGHERHPRPRRDAVHDARQRRRVAARARGQDGRLLPRRMRWPPAANTGSARPSPPYDELAPDQWLADIFRAEMVRLGRTPVAEDVEAALPLGSTDMGNVTQVMPGIHPIVGIDANGASVHQPAFAAAAAGPSADKAVVEGAIMLARTVVSLAETPAERDRVLELQARRAS